MLSDILPTGFECGGAQGQGSARRRPSLSSAPGPIGLAALLTAQFYSPAEIIMIDMDDNRLGKCPSSASAQRKRVINNKGRQSRREDHANNWRPRRRYRHRSGWCPRKLLSPARISWRQAASSPISAFTGVKADLHLERLWDRNIAITTRLVDTVSTPMLLKTVRARRIDPK